MNKPAMTRVAIGSDQVSQLLRDRDAAAAYMNDELPVLCLVMPPFAGWAGRLVCIQIQQTHLEVANTLCPAWTTPADKVQAAIHKTIKPKMTDSDFQDLFVARLKVIFARVPFPTDPLA